MMRRIYTIGYADWTPPALRETVLGLGATLVDVRIAPTRNHRRGAKKPWPPSWARPMSICRPWATATPSPAA